MLVLTLSHALAWSQHALISHHALQHGTTAFADEAVIVEGLESFLAAEQEAVAATFDAFYDGLDDRGATRFVRQTLDGTSTADFLRAARLSPTMTFPLILRTMPGDTAHGVAVGPEDVGPMYHPAALVDVEFTALDAGHEVSGAAVLATFTDEPDWGFDHGLWPVEGYGYGEQAFGKAEGESSKAPIHMWFHHENWIVRTFAGKVTESVVLDRVELFTMLSKTAFDTGHDYWGYRFAGWASHYVQDLAQPYHSKAVPSAGPGYYYWYVVSPRKDRIQERSTALSGNRHFLYEEYVAWALGGRDRDPATGDALAAELSSGEARFDVTTPEALLELLTRTAADHARTIDKALVKTFGPELTKDPSLDMEEVAGEQVGAKLAELDAAHGAHLLDETRADFSQAARATRTVLWLAHGD